MDWNRIDDDLAQINGRHDQLEGRIQQRYGLAKIWCGKTSITRWTLNRNGCR